MHRTVRVAVVALVALSLTGCSFLFVRGPGDPATRPPTVYPDCTSSMTWPIVDGALAAMYAFGAVGMLTTDGFGASTNDDEMEEAAIASMLFAIAAGAGSYIGYQRVSECRDARAAYVPPYPHVVPPYGYPPPQPGPYPQPYPGPYPPPQSPAAPQGPYPGPPPYAPPASAPAPAPAPAHAAGSSGAGTGP